MSQSLHTALFFGSILFFCSTDCDEQVRGVPNQFREKKRGRAEALAFYRASYERGEVEQWTEAE
jgi:YHS domain-containing protein